MTNLGVPGLLGVGGVHGLTQIRIPSSFAQKFKEILANFFLIPRCSAKIVE